MSRLVLSPPTQPTALTTASRGCCQWWRRWSGWSWRMAASTTSTCPSWACPSSARLAPRWRWETTVPPLARTGWVWPLTRWLCVSSESSCSEPCWLKATPSVYALTWCPVRRSTIFWITRWTVSNFLVASLPSLLTSQSYCWPTPKML